MEAPGGARDSRFNIAYNMGLLGSEPPPDMYGHATMPLGRAPPSQPLLHSAPGCAPLPRALKRPGDSCYDDRPMNAQMGLDQCPVPDMPDDGYQPLQPKKSPPSNGKKTKGRVKIKMEYIDNKLRRYTTFSKRKTGIMKKAYELSTLTGTQVMLLVASETGHVYTFATRKLQPMITSDSGKRLIQTCLNSPDPPQGAAHGGDQRMSATGFEETELTYNIADEETKCERSSLSSADEESGEESGSDAESPNQRQRSPHPAEPESAPRKPKADGTKVYSEDDDSCEPLYLDLTGAEAEKVLQNNILRMTASTYASASWFAKRPRSPNDARDDFP